MKKYIISLDQGTTSCRSILFDRNKKIIHTEQKEFSQIMPENGWVEHDPLEILETQLFTLKKVIEKSGIKADEIESIGITHYVDDLTKILELITPKIKRIHYILRVIYQISMIFSH